MSTLFFSQERRQPVPTRFIRPAGCDGQRMWGTAWSTALACVRSARDSQVPRAFNAINAQCAVNVPFPVLEYPEFVARMGSVIERHGNLGTPERVLFRTWAARPRLPAPKRDAKRAPAWFKPVLQAAA